jgi:hypothetical protein
MIQTNGKMPSTANFAEEGKSACSFLPKSDISARWTIRSYLRTKGRKTVDGRHQVGVRLDKIRQERVMRAYGPLGHPGKGREE